MGFPASSSGGAAGGSLAGTYPNPTIAAGVIVPSYIKYRYPLAPVNVGPSDSTEVTLFNQTIPGNAMAANSTLLGFFDGDWLNNHATTGRTFILRAYVGPPGSLTKVIDTGTSSSVAQSPNRRTWAIGFRFKNRAATNANQLTLNFMIGSAAAAITGISTAQAAMLSTAVGSTQVAVDTTADWALKVTLQLSLSEATLDSRFSGGYLEVM